MQNPHVPLVDPNFNRQNQTQKTSSIPRYERNNLNNSHSERSVRGNQKNELQVTGNPLDIWFRSAQFFQPLPTAEDIDKICDEMTIDSNSFINDKNSRKRNQNDRGSHHWSEQLNEIVQSTLKDSKKSNSSKQLLHLPRPPPAPNDISEYWVNQTPTFPISDLQKENRSIVHCLLCAFVEVGPDDSDQENKFLTTNVEADSDEDDINDENDDLLNIHTPAPQIEYDDYLRLPFEDRLEIELKCAGLDKPANSNDKGSIIFSQEIEQYKKEMANLNPQIEFFRNDIKQKLPQYKLDEERRISDQQTFQNLIPEYKKKSHKK
ncbi:hypothetical protein M9Y10_043822 [Tritrichomonas musculus]|uniref:Uncharacterized protein n=1 Tax=Tritrichomonas musculus TaxID=1915356 RepID=A0ABR2K1S5_9EUKA